MSLGTGRTERTYGDERTPEKRLQLASTSSSGSNGCVAAWGPRKKGDHAGALARNEDNRCESYGAEEVGVPREEDCATVDYCETLLVDYRCQGGDRRAGDTECDSDEGEGGPVEENTTEEAGGDCSAGDQDAGGRP